MLRQNADADLPGRDANGEGEDDRSLIAIGHQNPIAQPATACQIEFRLIHICKFDDVFRDDFIIDGLASAFGLFDELVGEDMDRIRDRQPDRLRGSEIEDQVELRRLFHR